jgi:hypothetical protein
MSESAHTERPRPAALRLTGRELAWWSAAAVLLGLVASIGCDPIQTAAFLLYPDNPNTVDPKAQSLTIQDKESKVLILVAHEDMVPSSLFRDANRELTRKLTQMLDARYKESQEKIKLASASKVLSYLDNHPDWVTESKRSLAKRFDADFVVFLQLGPMKIYEEGSHQTLYRGDVEVEMRVYDMQKDEDEEMTYQDVYKCTYPSTGPEDASGVSLTAFRMRFLDRIAKDLVQYFALHPPRDKVDSD